MTNYESLRHPGVYDPSHHPQPLAFPIVQSDKETIIIYLDYYQGKYAVGYYVFVEGVRFWNVPTNINSGLFLSENDAIVYILYKILKALPSISHSSRVGVMHEIEQRSQLTIFK